MGFDMKDLQGTLNAMSETMRQQFHQDQWARIIPVKNPMVEQLKSLVEETQSQNKILLEQVSLLKEENERQKSQVEEAKVAEAQAKKEALHSKVFGWVSFGVATAISVAALVVSIIALL